MPSRVQRDASPYIPNGSLREEPPAPNRNAGFVPSPLRPRPNQQRGPTPHRPPYAQPHPDPGYPGSNPVGYAVPYPPGHYPPPTGAFPPHFVPPPGGYPPGAYPPGAYPPPGPFPPPHGHGGFPPPPHGGFPPPPHGHGGFATPNPYNYAQAPPPPGGMPRNGQPHYTALYPQVPLGYSHGYHSFPYSGGFAPGHLPPFVQPEPQPVERPLEAGDVLSDKWAAGPNYGPVLTPLEVSILDVNLQINPLLAPSLDTPDAASLEYNVLLPVRTARRSTDPHGRSWTSGRTSPATFPRVTKLHLISKAFNWVITVEAEDPAIGVTCSDVMYGIHDDMNRVASRSKIEALPPREYNLLMTSYNTNRSTARYAPGGEFGRAVKRGDFLHRHIMFDGIVADEAFTLAKLGVSGPGWKGLKSGDNRRRGYPVTFVLNLDEAFVGRIHDHIRDSETSSTDARDDTTDTGETTATERDRDS